MPTQPIALVAPDSFKGTLSASEVAAALGDGLRSAGWGVDLAPVADGGEGTAAVLAGALGGAWVPCTVTGPLGAPVDAGYYLTGDGTALIDTAAAAGLALIPVRAVDPTTAWAASTAGVGQLIAAATRAGAREVLLGAGGSASTDGGRGAVEALTAAGGLGDARLRVLCDVVTDWADAAPVFGPQKGADAATVRDLESRLDLYARRLPRDPRGIAMSGAAGGLAGGLHAAFGAELVPGARAVLAAVRLRERAAAATAVITGEGRFDVQSLVGKLVSGVRECVEVPVHLVVGSSTLSTAQARDAGFASLTLAGDLDTLTDVGASFAPDRVIR